MADLSHKLSDAPQAPAAGARSSPYSILLFFFCVLTFAALLAVASPAAAAGNSPSSVVASVADARTWLFSDLRVGSSPQAPPPLVQWTHDDVTKWFNALPPRKRDKYGDFFLDEKHFPSKVDGESLARMKEERFVAILGDALGADLYEELQLLKAKCTFIMICRFFFFLTQPSRSSSCVGSCCC